MFKHNEAVPMAEDMPVILAVPELELLEKIDIRYKVHNMRRRVIIIASTENERLLLVDGVLTLEERCHWICPICSSRCGGISGHKGYHQCPNHYKPR